jgi:hypothetical protein
MGRQHPNVANQCSKVNGNGKQRIGDINNHVKKTLFQVTLLKTTLVTGCQMDCLTQVEPSKTRLSGL